MYTPKQTDVRFHSSTLWQGMSAVVDVVSEECFDDVLAPNSNIHQNVSHGGVVDANTQRPEDIQTANDKPDDKEACNDSGTSTG